MMKILPALLAVTTAAALVACSGGTNAASNAHTLTLASVDQGSIEDVVKAFEAANPGVKVNFTTSGADQYQQQIRTQLSSGTAPDVMTVWPGNGNPGTVHVLAEAGYLTDLSDQPYSWWQSQLKGNSVLAADTAAGATAVTLGVATGYHVGGTVSVDTGGGGDRLESRVITAVDGTTISFTPGLSGPHAAGAKVTGSGDRSWRTAFGPLVTDAWYSGADHDARREQPGWNRPGSDLSPTAERRDGSTMDWTAAGFAPPPYLATQLVARAAEPIRAQEERTPVSVTNPVPGTWVFDLGQNITAGPV